MSELAYNANGEAFDVPASVTGWRVRRMKPRGAPELVYGAEGCPLVVPLETTIDELRDAVGTAGKYRLDPVNDDGKCVDAVPPAYVQVVRQARNAEPAVASATTTSDDVIREAMRLNTELAKSVIDQFPAMMMSAAELLRAADGAGLPARQPLRASETDDDIETDEDDDEPAVSSGSPLLEMINQFAPIIIATLAPKLDGLFGVPKAIAETTAVPPSAPSTPVAKATMAPAVTPAPSKGSELPSLDPATLAKVMAVQAQLTPAEVARARQLGAQLSAAELRAFFDQLAALPVNEAVAKIRSLIGGTETPS